MTRLFRALSLALFTLIFATPCIAQRSGAPRHLCEGLANVPAGLCFGHEYQKEDEKLKSLSARIRQTLPSEEKAKFNEANKSWKTYRDLTCNVDSVVYFGGGSGQNTEVAICLYIETRLQIKDLHSIYDWEMRLH